MKVSILQYLLETQDEFISLLTLADKSKPEKLFNILDASDFEYHLFLKHLILLTDVGSEPLQRFNANFKELFPNKDMEYELDGRRCKYKFIKLPIKGKPTNAKMQIDTLENLQAACKDKDLCKDLIMFLIYGAVSTTPHTCVFLHKCNVCEYLGQKQIFIREGINKHSYRKFWCDDSMDERKPVSQWMLRNVFALS